MEWRVVQGIEEILLVGPIFTVRLDKALGKVEILASSSATWSRHQALVLSYLDQLEGQGVKEFNAAGVSDRILNKSLSLACGQAVADVAFKRGGEITMVEVETTDRLGRSVTGDQLIKLSRGSSPLILAVPQAATSEAWRVLELLKLHGRIQVEGIG